MGLRDHGPPSSGTAVIIIFTVLKSLIICPDSPMLGIIMDNVRVAELGTWLGKDTWPGQQPLTFV